MKISRNQMKESVSPQVKDKIERFVVLAKEYDWKKIGRFLISDLHDLVDMMGFEVGELFYQHESTSGYFYFWDKDGRQFRILCDKDEYSDEEEMVPSNCTIEYNEEDNPKLRESKKMKISKNRVKEKKMYEMEDISDSMGMITYVDKGSSYENDIMTYRAKEIVNAIIEGSVVVEGDFNMFSTPRRTLYFWVEGQELHVNRIKPMMFSYLKVDIMELYDNDFWASYDQMRTASFRIKLTQLFSEVLTGNVHLYKANSEYTTSISANTMLKKNKYGMTQVSFGESKLEKRVKMLEKKLGLK